MSCIFVYLCLTILIKWLTWDSTISGDAPSLLINLIGMFMMKVPSKREKTWIYGTGKLMHSITGQLTLF